MMQIQGKYNTARVYTDNIDNAAYSQILKQIIISLQNNLLKGKLC